ncbi:MAG: AbrB/MazE/SpoVT family DNA-binding domain-containing protein [Caldilineaceae bacterium]
MMRFELTAVDSNAIAIILPLEIFAQVGIGVGDQVEVKLVDQTIVLQPVEETERSKRIEEITEQLLVERSSLYQALAEGAQ